MNRFMISLIGFWCKQCCCVIIVSCNGLGLGLLNEVKDWIYIDCMPKYATSNLGTALGNIISYDYKENENKFKDVISYNRV